MVNKTPIGQSFQRLNNIPLDETMMFDTLAQAKDYVKNNPTVYKGQIIHVKDARSLKELNDGVNVYETSYYVDYYKELKPICSFTYEAMTLFFDLLDEFIDGPTEDTKNKINDLKEIMYDNYTNDFYFSAPSGDYKTEPWNPANYADNQIVLKMNNLDLPSEYIGRDNKNDTVTITCSNAVSYNIEDITIDKNGEKSYYKIITLSTTNNRDYYGEVCFRNGSYIEKVIKMCDMTKIRSASRMFQGCSNLISINDISTWDTSMIERMDYMFDECINLKQLDVSNFNTEKCTNFDFMFSRCKKLKELKVNGFCLNNVTNIQWMFKECSSLTSIDVSNWNTRIVSIMDGLFYGCINLIEIIGLDNFNTSNVSGMRYMFYDCNKLTDIDISSFDTSNVTSFDYMFEHCHSITSLDLSHFDISNASIIRMFKDCISLKFLNLNNWKKIYDYIGWYERLFENCLSLEFDNITMVNTHSDIASIITEQYGYR